MDTPKPNMKNILVAVDIENGDEQLITQASLLAQKFDAKVWIIHVAAPDPDFVGFDVGPLYVRKTLADDLREEHRNLHSYAKLLSDQGISAEAIMIQGPTVETIFDEAIKLEADLIVMGAHRHNFMRRVFGQDVSHQVIDKSKIPMLIVPL